MPMQLCPKLFQGFRVASKLNRKGFSFGFEVVR